MRMEEDESRWLCDGGSRVAAGTHVGQGSSAERRENANVKASFHT